MIVGFVVCLLATIYSTRISGAPLFHTPRALAEEKIVCESSACKERAQMILSSIDKTADPCEDFYAYACGNTMHEALGDGDASTPIEELTGEVVRKIYDYLVGYPKTTESRNVIESLVLAYRNCEKSELTLEQEIEATRKVLDSEGFTGWPLFKKDNTQKRFKSLKELLVTIGLDFLVNFEAQSNPGRKTSYTLQLGKPMDRGNVARSDSGGEESMPAGDRLAAKLYTALEATVSLFEPNASEQELKLLIDNVIDSIQNFPKFPLLELLNEKLKLYDIALHEDSDILIQDLPNLVATIKYLQTKEPDDIFNFVGMKRASELMMLSSNAYSHLKPIQEFEILARSTPPSRPVLCLTFINKAMPEVITRIYVENFFDRSTRSVARHLLNKLGKTYYQRLSHIPWMDHETWKNASNKLWNMLPNVAYSDSIMNDSLLELRYKNVKGIRRNDAFVSILKALQNQTESNALPLLRNDSSGLSIYNPEYKYEEVNSAYKADDNSLGVYAGILQGVFFNKDLPIFINLAAVGFVMAHELSHGFDNSGREHDEEGRMVDWWNNYTLEAFKEKAACFIKQYSSIRDPLSNMTLDGEKTLDENIADNAAVSVAFATLRHMLQDEPSVALPGLEKFTPEQLFFISFALPWCGNFTSSSIRKQIETDEHAPNRYRVNWPLKNTAEFSAAFHCKSGSAMRLPDHERCAVW